MLHKSLLLVVLFDLLSISAYSDNKQLVILCSHTPDPALSNILNSSIIFTSQECCSTCIYNPINPSSPDISCSLQSPLNSISCTSLSLHTSICPSTCSSCSPKISHYICTDYSSLYLCTQYLECSSSSNPLYHVPSRKQAIHCKYEGIPPADGSCPCQEGYYNILQDNNDSNIVCKACSSHCNKCGYEGVCLTCSNPSKTIVNGTCTCPQNSAEDQQGACKCNRGYYDLDLDTSNDTVRCNQCLRGCADCRSESDCLECVDSSLNLANGVCACPENAELGSNNKCYCKAGYYDSDGNVNNNTLDCRICPGECSACTSYEVCTACKEPTSIIVNGKCQCPSNASVSTDNRCYCNAGFYDTDKNILNSQVSCSLCSSRCATCSDFSICLSCSESTHILSFGSCTCPANSSEDAQGRCYCTKGYYDSDFNTSNDSIDCLACGEGCAICDSDKFCLECKQVTQVSNLESNFCECPEHSYLQDDRCICEVGYYDSDLDTSNDTVECKECHPDCAVCTSGDECISCKDPAKVPNTNTKKGCTCPLGSYLDESDNICYCEPSICGKITQVSPIFCEDESSSCTACSTQGQCVTCKYPYMYPNSKGECTCIENSIFSIEKQSCVCFNGYYLEEEGEIGYYKCMQCPGTCNSCASKEKCTSCINNSILEEGKCNHICEFGYYSSNFGCLPCDSLCTGCKDKANNCIECGKNTLSTPEGCICMPSYTYDPIYGCIQSFQQSSTDSALSSSKSYDREMTAEQEEILQYASLAFSTGTAAAVSINTLSMSSGIVWIFIDSSEFLCTLPLVSVELPEFMIKLYSKLSIAQMLPDLFLSLTSRNTYIKQDPIIRAEDNGYLTASFLDNVGFAIASYVMLMCLLLIQMILWEILKNTRLGKYIGHMTRSRIMSGIVRTYIQISLRMNIIAFLQIRYAVDTDIRGEVLCVIGLSLACIYLVLNTFIITKSTYLAVHSHALNVNNPASFYDFEELFSSIDTRKSVMNKLFYPLFMIRRFIHAAILLSVDDGQISGSIIAGNTVIFFIYVLICKPFESRVENWVLIVEEGVNSLNAVLVYLLIWDWGYIGLEVITKLAMISVLGFLAFFISLSLAILVYKLITWYKQRKQTPKDNHKVTLPSISMPNSYSHPKPSMAEVSFKISSADGNHIDFDIEDNSQFQTSRSLFKEFYSI